MASSTNPAVRGILLDIEGTTSSISFVHDVMFPYVTNRLESFLATQFARPDVQDACQQIARDAGQKSLDSWAADTGQSPGELVETEVRRLMSGDVKATGLKALQGLIWEEGFQSGELVAHVFPDVIPAIKQWRMQGIDVRIYSSGSIAAQKLFFSHLDGAGDCLSLFSGHYDTTSGGKKEAASYLRIAADWKLDPNQILFISDIAEELQAATEAGCQVRASVRPGNAPLPESLIDNRISSFAEVTL